MSAIRLRTTVGMRGVRRPRGARASALAALTLVGTARRSRRRRTASTRSRCRRARPAARSCASRSRAPPANPPAGFAIASPPRIALDFLDTVNALGATQRVVDDVALRSLNVIQAGNRTRVVFNLNRPQTFETHGRRQRRAGDADRPGRSAGSAQRRSCSASPRRGPATSQHALRDVDFRRGRNGEGRIVVDLSDNATGIDIRQQGTAADRRLHQDVAAAQPRAAPRRRRTSARRCVTVDTFAQGANTRMVIEPKGLWEHSAYQTDNRFILEVKPILEDPNKLMQGTRSGYKGEKLSLNFQNVEVRAGAAGDRRLHRPQHHHQRHGAGQPDAAAEGHPVGPGARHHPADQGPRHAQERQCRAHRAARGAGAQGEAAARERRSQIGELEPLHVRVVPAQLHRRRRTSSTSSRATGSSSSAPAAGRRRPPAARDRSSRRRGVAIVDPRINILFVQDTAAQLEEVRKIIRQIDTPIRQVLIEARIVIASDRFSQQLGVRFGEQTGFTFNNGSTRPARAARSATQPVVSRLQGDRLDPRDANADAVRARVGHRVPPAIRTRRSSTSTCRCPTPPASSR